MTYVEGQDKDGATVLRNTPVLIGGVDATGHVRTMSTGSDGSLTASFAPAVSGTATLANVSSSASSVTLLAANSARQGATIVNDSTAILYVKFGTTASATSFSYLLSGSVSGIPATLEVPFAYTGLITGIWASATGAARTTEFEA